MSKELTTQVSKTPEEMKQELNELIEKRTELRMQNQSQQLKQPHLIKQVRRKIADIKRRMHAAS